jgi:hypothetical protein
MTKITQDQVDAFKDIFNFAIGMEVKIIGRLTQDEFECNIPNWVDDMDQYIGRVGEIRSVSSTSCSIETVDGNGEKGTLNYPYFTFLPVWTDSKPAMGAFYAFREFMLARMDRMSICGDGRLAINAGMDRFEELEKRVKELEEKIYEIEEGLT